MSIASTLFSADAGTVTIDGHNTVSAARAVRSIIGVTGQYVAIDDLFSGRENLTLMADLRHSDARRVVGVRTNCSSSSISWTPPIARSRPTPAVCVAASISR